MPGWTTIADDTIDHAVIDNLQYAYSASCGANTVKFAKVTISYVGAP